MKVIFGTTNQGKIDQVKGFMEYKKIDMEFISLKDIGFNEDIIENGETIEENSLIKAKAIKEFCNKNNINEVIVTDDAGLFVDALDGEPGVHTARYAGDHAPQIECINKLLTELKDVPDEKRGATFACVLTAILRNGEVISCRGETRGKIVRVPGTMGKLTYGPVLQPDGLDRVINDLTEEELGLTHRDKAWLELVNKIKILS
ncbi:MAG: non-canonical purine NTP pyrophosphatase [Clostridia bacterium]|nr:non-canonical purine NTP pyrophosphatase [Clostridia bacterium]MCI8961516.1 non-canonical purine NTP pyrophosphatase [Clostridia bacterium]